MTLVAYRLAARRFIAAAFTGEGAWRWGGRWNPVGISLVYTSGSLSLASLEFLAHLDSRAELPETVSFQVRFEERLVSEPERLPPNWRDIPAPPSTEEVGANWFKSGRSAILRVPSIIIPSEFNFLLNPAHPDFRLIEISPPEPFSIDPRLLGNR
jgi:RES domain-containing protein